MEARGRKVAALPALLAALVLLLLATEPAAARDPELDPEKEWARILLTDKLYGARSAPWDEIAEDNAPLHGRYIVSIHTHGIPTAALDGESAAVVRFLDESPNETVASLRQVSYLVRGAAVGSRELLRAKAKVTEPCIRIVRPDGTLAGSIGLGAPPDELLAMIGGLLLAPAAPDPKAKIVRDRGAFRYALSIPEGWTYAAPGIVPGSEVVLAAADGRRAYLGAAEEKVGTTMSDFEGRARRWIEHGFWGRADRAGGLSALKWAGSQVRSGKFAITFTTLVGAIPGVAQFKLFEAPAGRTPWTVHTFIVGAGAKAKDAEELMSLLEKGIKK